MKLSRWIIVLTFGSALLGEAASWLVRFGSPLWAPLKVASFLGLQATLAVLLVAMALYLFRRGSSSTQLVVPVDDSPTD